MKRPRSGEQRLRRACSSRNGARSTYLFNGFTVEATAANRAKLAKLPGVKALYPVEIIAAPSPERSSTISPDLVAAINSTGASAAQSAGYSGKGIKVGIIDTGIDIDHPAFGGGGEPRRHEFPEFAGGLRL